MTLDKPNACIKTDVSDDTTTIISFSFPFFPLIHILGYIDKTSSVNHLEMLSMWIQVITMTVFLDELTRYFGILQRYPS